MLTIEQKRAAAAERKRKSRASIRRLELQLPKGTGDALDRVCKAGGFEEPQELIALLIHKTDEVQGSELFDWLTAPPKPVIGDLSKYVERIGAEVEDDDRD